MQENPDDVLAPESPVNQATGTEPAPPVAESIENAPVLIPVKWIGRVRFAKTQAHLGAGVGLLALGLTGLVGQGEHILMPLVSVLVASLYLGFAAREFIHIRRGLERHSRIGWIEILAGLVVLMEGFERYKPGKIFQPATCMMAIALALFVLGLFHERLRRTYRLEVSDEGFKLRLSPLGPISIRWMDVADLWLREKDKRLLIRFRDGRQRTIKLRRVANRNDIHQAIAERFRLLLAARVPVEEPVEEPVEGQA